MMFKRKPIYAAVASAMAASATAIPVNAQQLEEILVTATKRTESLQDVAVAVQALNGSNLEDMNVSAFDDYIRYLPSATAGGRGPGQNTVFIRGMATNQISTMLSGSQGTMPNVALYLDEQPVTAPGRNLDPYITDIERVEVLPGPQGTLFGASSQAGTVRIITNKPLIDIFEAGFTAGMAATKDGAMSNSAEAHINLPLVDGKFAVRGAFYNDSQGGYIDNVEGSKQLSSGNPSFPAGATLGTAHNTALVEEDFNDASYRGARLSGRYVVNADWDLLLQHTQQDLSADGVFDYDPTVGDLEVQRYFPDELEDSFGQTSWTLEGRLAALDAVYTGAYLDREIEQRIDYTGYSDSGAFVPYYICNYPAYTSCTAPDIGFQGQQWHERVTHEFRVSGDLGDRWSVVAGVFYDDLTIETIDNYLYLLNNAEEFAPNAPISAANSIDPSPRASDVGFFNDITRTESQLAFFGELGFDLVPDTLTATVGLRQYNMESDFTGSSNFTPLRGGPDDDRGRNYDAAPHTTSPLELDDVIPKFTLTWNASPDVLFYGTYSEGFRPGGFNRGGGLASANPTFPSPPVTYNTDDVVNYEFGWKTELMNGDMRFNGSAYMINWSDMQLSRFDPVNVSILTFIENAADAEIRGIEGDLSWAATDSLVLFGSFSYNDTELVETKAQIVELVPEGSSLPLTPELQLNARARYSWFVGDYDAYWQLALQYAGETTNSLVAVDSRKQESYTNADFSVGVRAPEGWHAEMYIENLTDERAELFWNTQDDSERVTTNRPRTIGLKVSYDF